MTVKKIFYRAGLAVLVLFSLYSCENNDPVETPDIQFGTVNGFVNDKQGEN